MTKVESVRKLLATNPEMTSKAIAEAVGCHVELARRVRNGSYRTPFKDAKERCIARNMNRGRDEQTN